MTEQKSAIQGLTSAEAQDRQVRYGKNQLTPESKDNLLKKTLHIIIEPMFLLLIGAAIVYFILGEPRDGAIMLVFVIGIISIDVIQEWKTDRTLNALKDLSAPQVKVIRDGAETWIASANLVPGDLMVISEGVKISADGMVIKASDLCVDESSLTGEAEGVWKVTVAEGKPSSDYWRKEYCYAGTLVIQGSAYVLVDKIGAQTEYGKIGSDVASAPDRPTPLEKQTRSLVKVCAAIAIVLMALVALITWFNITEVAFKSRLIDSILSGITLAMAMIPEEFPVILAIFLSMGAWRLAKKQSLVRRLSSVETLGAVSVLCVDKTGTITANRMQVQEVWAIDHDENKLCETMGLGCETDTYDPMEKAMLQYCEELGIPKDHIFGGELIKEYAFTNEAKMMGHVWRHDDALIIAAKGSPERILGISDLTDGQKEAVNEKILTMSKVGFRVIAVGQMRLSAEIEIPEELAQCKLSFNGLVGLWDPPRDSIKEDIGKCTKAGVRVVMITGDNGITASSIAKQINMPNSDSIITGDELDQMTDEELQERVKEVNIFSRVIPEHKMRIVKAFKENGEVVAMTGDGVNDAPALKYADIGIAMGKRGSEVSREAADLVLMDDNFSTIVHTIKDGRRIYDNIRKAVGYVFTIHIPIALACLLAPILGIGPSSLLLLPLHVVLLETVIDPTCSVVLERQPAEANVMERKPRNPKEKILTGKVLCKSIIQGAVIFAASFGAYYWLLAQNPDNAAVARAMGLVIIMLANLFLVQVNSSDRAPVWQSMRQLKCDKVIWTANVGTVAGILLILYTPLSRFFKVAPLSWEQLLIAVVIAAASVLWYELFKFYQRAKSNLQKING